MGVAGANIHTVRWFWRVEEKFELVLRSVWGRSGPGKQPASSTPCWKRGQIWDTESNSGQDICSRDASVGNGKNFEKQAQCSKG